MRIVFMGTPDFAVPSLQALCASGHEIAGVVTQPDRPKGRGHKLTPSPVKVAALEAGLNVYQPERVKSAEFIETLRQLSPQLIAVVAFGQILSREILELPDYGCINVHASLLPKYRGPAPIHWAVINGEPETGVTIMQMDEGLDTGDIILTAKVPILPEDTTGTVHDKLAELGAQLLVKAIEEISAGRAEKVPQDHRLATYAPLLTKQVGEIDWTKSALEISNLVRGLNPWPGAYTLLGDRILKIWRARPCTAESITAPVADLAGKQPGEILGRVPGAGFAVAAADSCLVVMEVQLQGSRRMGAEDFMHGHCIEKGFRLGRG